MNTYVRTYWFTWAFLVVAAALTGVASLKDAFFGGLFASLFSALLAKPFEKIGPRFAPLLGAAAGTLWVVVMLFRIRWFGYEDDYAMAQWTLGTDISVHAAGFGGAALMTALCVRAKLPKALLGGFLLAAAMTVLPYGFISWVDHRVAGPVEVVLLVSADVPAGEGPARRPGAVAVSFNPAEKAFLKQRLLVVEGPGGDEVLDNQGRRFWPLWRRRLVYPGNPGGPVRTVLLILPSGLTAAETWTFPVDYDPKGMAMVFLDSQQRVSVAGVARLNPSVELEVSLLVKMKGEALHYQALQIQTTRRSPVGDFYARILTQGLSAEFPPPLPEANAKEKQVEKPRANRPSFGPAVELDKK
jgi:hypothetical protein